MKSRAGWFQDCDIKIIWEKSVRLASIETDTCNYEQACIFRGMLGFWGVWYFYMNGGNHQVKEQPL